MAKDQNFIQNIESFIKNTKAKAAYFADINGDRTAVFIEDMSSTDMIPAIADPFFQMGTQVEFHPAMVLEDLKNGLAAIPR